jgi:hypothetical protein
VPIRGGWPEAIGEDTVVTGSGLTGMRVEACEGSCTKGIVGSASGACKIERGTKLADGLVKLEPHDVVWD